MSSYAQGGRDGPGDAESDFTVGSACAAQRVSGTANAGAAERNGSIGTRKVPRPLRSADPASDHTSRYSPPLLVTLTGVAVAHRRLAPSSSATTSTVDRALPSSAVQLRCCSRPTTTTRLPLAREWAACSAWSRHTTTVKNDASCSFRPLTATRNLARAMPPSVERTSGSSVRLPAKLTLASVMVHPSWDCLAGRCALPLD